MYTLYVDNYLYIRLYFLSDIVIRNTNFIKVLHVGLFWEKVVKQGSGYLWYYTEYEV